MNRAFLIVSLCLIVQGEQGCIFPQDRYEKTESAINATELHARIEEFCGEKGKTASIPWTDEEYGKVDMAFRKCYVIFANKIAGKGYLPIDGPPFVETYRGVRVEHGMAYYPRPSIERYYIVAFYYKGLDFYLEMRIPGEPGIPRQQECYFSEVDYSSKGVDLAKWVIDYFDRKL